jgi:hypothetical protein
MSQWSRRLRLLKRARGLTSSTLAILIVLVFVIQAPVAAITASERRQKAFRGISFIDDPCTVTGGATTDVDADVSAAANAKVIMGIAKTYGLGKRGALIGLMTGIAESHLKIYGNSGIPLSLTHPSIQATGNDHDSLGIMQQRVSTGWSTFGNSASREVVYQLMDPSYNAQAFFGTPRGADLPNGLAQPSALRKGLQNLSGWEAMRPWEAAQRVQISAYDGRPRQANNFSNVFGGNYKSKMSDAQSLINQFWDSAPAIPLPVPITGGDADADATTTDSACLGLSFGNILETIVAYSWPEYHDAPYYEMKPEYKAAVRAARANGEYVGGNQHPGIDCGGYVTRVMRDSGADPKYNSYEGYTGLQYRYLEENIGSGGKYEKMRGVRGTGDLPTSNGEVYIAVIPAEHTYFYTGAFTYVDEAGQQKTWSRNGASASIGPYSWRTPMASNAFDFSRYHWYKVIGSEVPQEL